MKTLSEHHQKQYLIRALRFAINDLELGIDPMTAIAIMKEALRVADGKPAGGVIVTV